MSAFLQALDSLLLQARRQRRR